ncbi:MAG TPA: hypothetical protein VN678_03990 [Acidobacteriaceae bacterium]|nr:hypothetical protein [Acidobacteriaceae bacterium]
MPRASAFRITEVALLTIAAMLYVLHFVHLRADFPNRSPWPDWAKYTDEGWYGLAAIRHYQLGHWNVPGDFNPAAALPVWPLLELVVFRFTGVSLVAARALTVVVFGLILVCCYLLLRRWAAGNGAAPSGDSGRVRSLSPAIAALLLAASPFYFAFSRLAILEPLMILLALAALIVAQRAGAAVLATCGLRVIGDTRSIAQRRAEVRMAAWSAGGGLLTVAMVLTKTTALFLLPAVGWMLWASCAYRVRVMLRASAIAVAVAAAIWGGYMLLFVRPRYMADYRYLFSANAYTGITGATFWRVLVDTFLAGKYLGATFFFVGVAAVALLLGCLAVRRFRRDGLVVSLLLWVFFYFAFLAYHDNLQARYYQAVGVPLAMLIAMGLDRLWRLSFGREAAGLGPGRKPRATQAMAAAASLLIAFIAVRGAWQSVGFAMHPEYTFLSAVNQVHDAIERQRAEDRAAGRPVHPEMVLSISGAEMQLMTGLPSICDDFGTMSLPDRIAAYKPGWFLAWNDVEDDKMEALAPMYRLVRAGAWPAFDDPDRNLTILYRLDPVASPGRGNSRNRRKLRVPRRLQTKVGEQPDLRQLEH